MDVEAETIKLNTSLSSVVTLARVTQSANLLGGVALSGVIGVGGASLIGIALVGSGVASGLASGVALGGALPAFLLTGTLNALTQGVWAAGTTAGVFSFVLGTGPTFWAAPVMTLGVSSGTGITATVTVGLGVVIASIAIVVTAVVVPAVLIDRITDAADRAKDYTESDRQDIGGNRAGLIFDLRTVEGDFSRSEAGPAALQTSIDALNTALAGMRFQRDRTDCG